MENFIFCTVKPRADMKSESTTEHGRTYDGVTQSQQ